MRNKILSQRTLRPRWSAAQPSRNIEKFPSSCPTQFKFLVNVGCRLLKNNYIQCTIRWQLRLPHPQILMIHCVDSEAFFRRRSRPAALRSESSMAPVLSPRQLWQSTNPEEWDRMFEAYEETLRRLTLSKVSLSRLWDNKRTINWTNPEKVSVDGVGCVVARRLANYNSIPFT